MKDRVVQYPSRYQLVLVAGTTDIYDLVSVPGTVTEEGTPLNKASLLKDTTAALVGLGISALPDEALRAAALKMKSRLIQSYAVAGTYTWTAPDLNDGADYEVGVLIIGGGGSGGAAKRGNTSQEYVQATGGGSGFSRVLRMIVTPGNEYSVVVGTGGAAVTVTANPQAEFGLDGGSSAFNGNAVDGGAGGAAHRSTSTPSSQGAIGAQPSTPIQAAQLTAGETPYGGTFKIPGTAYNMIRPPLPLMCINPFTGKTILAAGGSAASVTTISSYQKAEDVVVELGDNDGFSSAGMSIYQQNSGTVALTKATSPGCGGGAIVHAYNTASVPGSITSAAGADGGVFIYV